MSKINQCVFIGLLVPATFVFSSCVRKSKVEAAERKEVNPATKSTPYRFGVSRVLTLPAGTRFAVMVPSKGSGTGSTVEGELVAPISAYTETVVPRGTKVVTEVSDSATKGDTQVSLRATQIRLKNGKVVNISSDEPRVVADSGEKLVSFRLINAVQVTVER